MMYLTAFPAWTRLRRWATDEGMGEILSGSTLSLASRTTVLALGLISNVILARAYGADVVGAVAMVNSFLLVGATVTILGTNTAVLRLIPEHRAKSSVSSAFRVFCRSQFVVIATSLAAGLTFFAISDWIAAAIFSKPQWSAFLGLAGIFVALRAIGVLNVQALRGLKQIRTMALLDALPAALVLTFLVVTVIALPGRDAPVYAYLAGIGGAAVVGGLVVLRTFRNLMTPGDRVEKVSFRSLFAMSLPMWMTSALVMVIGQTGVVILGVFRGEDEVGHYAVAVRLAALATFILLAVETIAAPKFSELSQAGRTSELLRTARKSAKLIFWSTIPILLILLVAGRLVLGTVFGASFSVAYPALVVLLFGQFVNAASGATASFMNMTGHHVPYRNITAIAAILNIAASLILIPTYGPTGAALAATLGLIAWNLATLGYIRRRHGHLISCVPFMPVR